MSLCACIVPTLDLSGRPCPCVDGWQCDPSTQTCERGQAGSTSVGDAGDSDTADNDTADNDPTLASSEDTAAATPFDVTEFAADWSTPTSIHWAWTIAGEEADFHAYEVWVATSEAALSDQNAVAVFDGSVNPELSRWILNNTNGTDAVLGTITDGLEPGVDYFARLFVLDTSGGRTHSPNVAVRATNTPPVSEAVIFADDPPGGQMYPECMQRVDTNAAAGSTHSYAHQMMCEPGVGSGCQGGGAPECWENLRLQNLTGPPLSIGGGEFADAFIEVYVAIDSTAVGDAHGWWSEVGIQGSDDVWHSVKALTIRADGAYRRYEIPLTQLGLTSDTFDGVVAGFRVGSTFPDATTVRFDEVRIRW